MKNYFLGILYFSTSTYLCAQTNPFKEYGDKSNILTLSNGKYDELHFNDTLQRVGTAVVNMRTGQVVGFIETDTLYSESSLEPEIVSRWYSPDPLAAKYPNLSPYNAFANNPIFFTDPDGRDIVPTITKTYQDKSGKTIIEITIDVDVAVLASNKITMSNINPSAIATGIADNLRASLVGKYGDNGASLVFKAGKINVNAISDPGQVKANQHLVVIVDNVTGTTTDKDGKISETAGRGKFGAKVSYVENQGTAAATAELATHELGHNFNLEHNWETEEFSDDDISSNYMSYSANRSQFSPSQLRKIYVDYNKGVLNKGKTTKTLTNDDNSYSGTSEKKPYNSGTKGSKVPLNYDESGR